MSNVIVIGNQEDAEAVGLAYNSPEIDRAKWPRVLLGQVGEEDLSYLGIDLGVCDEDQDSIAGELLYENGRTFICLVIPEFVEVLSRLDDNETPRRARAWRDGDGRRCAGPKAATLLAALADLARQATATGKSVLLVSSARVY